jgi:hypothetical protein
MGIFHFLQSIKLVSDIVSIIRGLFKSKIINLWLVILLTVSFGSLYFYLISIQNFKNTIYHSNFINFKIENKIEEVLKNCGSKTAISVASISLEKREKLDSNNIFNNFHEGLFVKSLACDFEINKNNCIIDLLGRNFNYKQYYEIDDAVSYKFFEDISSKDYIYIDLKRQDDIIPIARNILQKSDWHNQGVMHSIFIASVLNKNNNIIYVIILTSANKDGVGIKEIIAMTQLKTFIEEITQNYE